MDLQFILLCLLISDCSIQQINAPPVSSKNARSYAIGWELVGEENNTTCAICNTSGTFSVEYGSCIILNCQFDEVVQECAWMSHTHLPIAGRYIYTGPNAGTNTQDCTIKIEDFQIIDEAKWRCTSMETFNSTMKNGPVMLLSGRPKRPHIEFNKTNPVINCSAETKYKSPNQLYWVIDGQKTPPANKMQVETTRPYTKITFHLNNNEGKIISCVAQYNDGTLLTSETFIQRPLPAQAPYIWTYPSTMYIPQNDSVKIECRFKTAVDCAWMRRQKHTDISARYGYTEQDNGRQTTNCDIIIHKFGINDVGEWICRSMADDKTAAIDGTRIVLQMKPTVNPQSERQITAPPGANPTIKCSFDMNVSCTWAFKGGPIKRPYQYLERDANGINTSNCSIVIFDVKKEDEGPYTCITTQERVSAPPITLKIIENQQERPTDPQITVAFDFTATEATPIESKFITEYAVLKCTSANGNSDPEMHWEIDGNRLDIKAEHCRDLTGAPQCVLWLNIFKYKAHIRNGSSLSCVANHAAFDGGVLVDTFALHINSSDLISDSPSSNNSENSYTIYWLLFGIPGISLVAVGVIVIYFLKPCNKDRMNNCKLPLPSNPLNNQHDIEECNQEMGLFVEGDNPPPT